MADRIQLTQSLLAALAESDEVKLRALLSEQPAFTALSGHVTGLRDVLTRLTHEPVRDVYRQVAWDKPETDGDAIIAIGRLPTGAARAGVVLTLHFDGERISLIQQQNLPPRPAQTTPLKLTPKLKHQIDNALATRRPMLLAYADASGQPALSFRGSTQTYSDDQLALWIRNADGQLMQAIARNPKVALMYRDEDSKATYQFQGRARIATSDAERQRIYQASAPVEQAHDFAHLGVAIIIDLDRIEGYAGLGPSGQIDRVRMERSS